MKTLPKLRHLPGVAGLDEAGRGPLAGPVYAAAVILPKGFRVTGLNDSKQLAPRRREELAIRIKEKAIWAISFAEVEEIDRLNILWASMAAMARALRMLSIVPERALVDGNKLPGDLACSAEAIVDGDAKYACIAAASILAKTERDRVMRGLALQYPEYGFENHFGYSTPEHKRALRQFGPCEIHRRSFWPMREMDQFSLPLDDEILCANATS